MLLHIANSRHKHTHYVYAAFLLNVAVVLFSLTGCTPVQSYVEADRAIYDAVAPAHARYVAADAALQPAQRELRLATLEQWRKLIESAEAAQGATTRPTR